MKQKIFFVQPNTMLGNSIYFPYAVGVIASYAFAHEEIREAYSLSGIIFKEDSDTDFFNVVKDPFLVGFSNYFWNYAYNLRMAEQLKKKYPNCIIVFGGHQVPRSAKMLEDHPFIDCLIFSEGEIPFYRILKALMKGKITSDIANIAFRGADGKIIKTEDKAEGVKDYPSPYLSGIFDHLCNVPQGLEFNAQLETNRGCPYHCSFCDWCDYDVDMRLFPIEKVKADLKWIAEHNVAYCMCVDSNFGMFPRDEEIAGYAVEMKQKYGFPDKFGACFAKDKTDRIFTINKIFNDAGMSKGVSLAFQSMSDEVLRNISRKNMNKDKLSDQLKLYHKAGIPSYTELILGLPGETYESFCSGICELLELGQHDSINVFRCEVYPNSALADPAYMKKFGIKTAVNKLNINHCSIPDAVFSGGLDYIVETSTMTPEELVDANVFSCCIQSVHCHGLLQFLAIYLHNDCGIKYYDFYDSFIRYFSRREGFIGSVLRKITQCIAATAESSVDLSYINPVFGNITWPYEESMLLDFIYEKDRFYREIDDFIAQFRIDEHILKELMRFQKNMIVLPGENNVRESFDYRFAEFFDAAMTNAPVPLKKQKCVLHFYAGNAPEQWDDYARQIVWYGRRNRRSIRKVEEESE